MTLDRGLRYALLAVILMLVASVWARQNYSVPWSPLVCTPVDVNRGQALVMVNCERQKYTDRLPQR